jgi:glutaredoxin 3
MSTLSTIVKTPHIILYTKTGCPWGTQAIDFLDGKYIPFEERNMTENDAYRLEAIDKSGQWKCPTLDIEGHILADSDAKQIETYLVSIGVLTE